MDSDKYSAQIGRLEVVETGRRPRWSEDEKLKIVLESLQTPRQVAATTRRYGISRSLLLRWRRLFRCFNPSRRVSPRKKGASHQQRCQIRRQPCSSIRRTVGVSIRSSI